MNTLLRIAIIGTLLLQACSPPGVATGHALEEGFLAAAGEGVAAGLYTDNAPEVFGGQSIINKGPNPITIESIAPVRLGPHLELIGILMLDTKKHPSGFSGVCGAYPPKGLSVLPPRGMVLEARKGYALPIIGVRNPQLAAESVDGLRVVYRELGREFTQDLYYHAFFFDRSHGTGPCKDGGVVSGI